MGGTASRKHLVLIKLRDGFVNHPSNGERMNDLAPFPGVQGSVFEAWMLIGWVLVLLIGLAGTVGIACIIGLVWAQLHPR